MCARGARLRIAAMSLLRVVAIAILLALLGTSAASAESKVTVPAGSGPAAVLKAARSAKARTGLGLPPYKRLLGKRWARRVKAADARLVRRVHSPARAAAAPIDDPEPMKAADSIKGKGGRQTRNLRVATAIETGPCPRWHASEGEGLQPGFDVRGRARGVYVVTTVERVGRFDVTTHVVFDARFELLAGTSSSGTLGDPWAPDGGTISVTRSQTATNRRTGRTRSTGETQRYTDDLGPLLTLEGGFDDFVEANGTDDPPAPRRKLRADVWKDQAQKFVAMVYLRILPEFQAVGRRMQTPNACVGLTFAAPERLAPSQSVPLTGRLALTQGTSPAADLYHNAHILLLEYIHDAGQKHRQLSARPGDWRPGEAWYEFTAPPRAWPEAAPAGMGFTVGTYAGVAQADVLFKPLDPELHFKVVGASFTTRTSATSQDVLCGTTGGQITYSGDFADDGFHAEDTIELGANRVDGEIDGRVHARWTGHHLDGCKSGPGGMAECHTDMPDREFGGDGTRAIGFSASAAADPSKVRLTWSIDQPEVGFVDAGDDECNVHIWGSVAPEVTVRDVPLSTFTASGPQELRFEGTAHLDRNQDGMLPASIDCAWTYVLRIQRTDAAGHAL